MAAGLAGSGSTISFGGDGVNTEFGAGGTGGVVVMHGSMNAVVAGYEWSPEWGPDGAYSSGDMPSGVAVVHIRTYAGPYTDQYGREIPG